MSPAYADTSDEGLVVARRLNRLEYQNSVRDLLGVNVDFQEMLPPENMTDGFDNVGDALPVSSFLLERYLETAGIGLDLPIRQKLVKHREDDACASCHAEIDPPGFALENFDVIGRWLDRYRLSCWTRDAQEVVVNGLKMRYYHGVKVETIVFFSSNLDDASTHSTKNLPVLLAGGGFRHGQHLAFQPNNPPPLSNLYLSMLHRLGIHADKFASSTGTLVGLET